MEPRFFKDEYTETVSNVIEIAETDSGKRILLSVNIDLAKDMTYYTIHDEKEELSRLYNLAAILVTFRHLIKNH